MNEVIEQVEVGTGVRRPLAPPGSIVVRGGRQWSGIRVEHVVSPPFASPPCYVPNIVVSVLLKHRCRMETGWRGGPRRTWTAPPGSVFIRPARMPIEHTNFGRAQNINVEILPDMLAAVHGRPLELRPEFGVEDHTIARLLGCLGDQLYAEHPVSHLFVESLGAALLDHVRRKYGLSPQEVVATAGLSPHRLRLAQEHIDAHLSADLSPIDIAKLVGLNVDYFTRAFRQSTGVPPHRYIVMRRIERAKALMLETRCSLVEIALHSGFGSQSSFTRAFKNITGLTPRQYRLQLR